jgi:hypothetical protein
MQISGKENNLRWWIQMMPKRNKAPYGVQEFG